MLILFATAAFAEPALVTTSRGDVDVVAGGQKKDAPAAPFVLDAGQTLQLADGAVVVVLADGAARQITGPATFDPAKVSTPVAPATQGGGALDDLLARHVSAARPGATRGGLVALTRPVPGTAVEQPAVFRWRCADCGTQEVQLYDFQAGDVVWHGKGDGEVRYDGPALHPGAWSLSVGGTDFSFVVLSDDEKATVEKARTAAEAAGTSLPDPASKASLPAAVYVQAGLPTEALELLDAAVVANPKDEALQKLRAEYEKQAGVAP